MFDVLVMQIGSHLTSCAIDTENSCYTAFNMNF